MVKEPTTYTAVLTPQQASALEEALRGEGFEFFSRPYTRAFAQKDKLTVAIYEKGPKVVVQGRGTGDFVRYLLEPRILGEARLDYEELHNPAAFEPHFGIDESGKGDFFGPLVIAGVFTDRSLAQKFRELGVADSKRITSDARVRALASAIRKSRAPHELVVISPARYNELMAEFGNLNRLLAWGHARVIENLAARCPGCPRALSDKFADVRVLARALMERGRQLELEQRTKAESDYAVAAASILAREAFIDWLEKGAAPRVLPRGVSAAVKQMAREIVREGGREALARVAKMHFRTAAEVLTSEASPSPDLS
ncbi:MAG: ribonuclease HIII [Terrimicrobiaceae bacterium]|nr:ribonuclease HIII [Terrimicrobiaceae bacterium]